MKKLSEILETTNQNESIDQQWLNDDKPVKTADGKSAIILDIDLSEVPNIIKGQVKLGTKLLDYEWEDNGKCLKATDQYGNPKKPTENDDLVKDIAF